MNFNIRKTVKKTKRRSLEALLYSFIYRELRKISKKYGVHIMTNNYGYYPTSFDDYDKYQKQMYDEYANLMEAESVEQVLEIGSGAGGGLIHMQSRLPKAQFAGLDHCKEAIKSSKYFLGEQHKSSKLYTDINDIFADCRKFDAIVSVETHIFKKSSIFADIHNLLNENGVFIYYDNTKADKSDRVARSIEYHGFRIELLKDITENVLKSCEHDTKRRLEIADKYISVYLRPFRSQFLHYMCVKDSPRYSHIGSKALIEKPAIKYHRNIDLLRRWEKTEPFNYIYLATI